MSFTHGMWKQHQQRLKAAGKGQYSVYPNPRHHKRNSPFGEQFARDGSVLVTLNQLALLRAISQHPEQSFPTIGAWVAATSELSPNLYGRGLHRCVRRVPEIWVSRTRHGPRKLCALQARGRAIVNGEIPVWLRGVGRIDREAVKERGAQPQPLPPAETALAARSKHGLSLGQLLDRLDRAVPGGDDLSDEAALTLTRRVVEDEIALSAWRVLLESGDSEVASAFAAMACEHIPAREALDEFVATVGSVGLEHAAQAARHALSFPDWLQQMLALEEVVLGAEARAGGLPEAAASRRRFRDEIVEGLNARLVAVLPGGSR